MGLSIQTTSTQIGIHHASGKWNIESQKATLHFRTKQAKVNLDTELPMVIIDQYECFATAGLKNNYDLTRSMAQKAYQQLIEYIGKTASDGNTLAAIENGGNPIKAIAVRDAYPEHTFGIDSIPKARPKISFTGGVNIEWEDARHGARIGIEGQYNPGYIMIDYKPSDIDIYVKQYPKINIEYLGNSIDSKI